MDRPNSVVCVCETHGEAGRAMYNLQAAHIDMGTLSIATKDVASNLHKVDYYDLGEESFSIPGIGPLLVSGPLASWIVAAFNDVANRKGASILGAALSAIGIAPDSVLKYEAGGQARPMHGVEYLLTENSVETVHRPANGCQCRFDDGG
jgi:hypothetical protein